jgi:hypothetical protein
MLNVLFTVDTEIWCGEWTDLDRRFPTAFKHYVYGPTSDGNFALPGLFRTLNEYGLTAAFMVETLFATRFGLAPLEEMVGLIRDAGQEVQLHLHPEWADESIEPLIPLTGEKRPLMRQFSFADQRALIAHGRDLLLAAGAPPVTAFRAGSYGLNLDTLKALHDCQILIDTSYNPGYSTGVADVAPGHVLMQPEQLQGVAEFPVTAYRDGRGAKLRHMQLTACSFAEMKQVLESAEESGYEYVVIVAHNFELLTPDKQRQDKRLVRRFERLCQFLSSNAERFNVCGFNSIENIRYAPQPEPVKGSVWRTAERHVEQLLRRLN